jgi:hypothetical protein
MRRNQILLQVAAILLLVLLHLIGAWCASYVTAAMLDTLVPEFRYKNLWNQGTCWMTLTKDFACMFAMQISSNMASGCMHITYINRASVYNFF